MINSVVKSPEDQLAITIFFDGDFDAGEVLSYYSICCTDINSGELSGDSVIASSSQTDQSVEIIFRGGQDAGENHSVSVKATSSNGKEYSVTVNLDVEDVGTETFNKQAGEKFVVKFDFDSILDDGKTLSSATITAVDDTGADVSGSVVGSSGIDTTDGSRSVAVEVYGGDDGDFIAIGCQVDSAELAIGYPERYKRTAFMAVANE